MPSDPLAQAEGQLGLVLIPRPLGGEVGYDRLQARLRHILLIHDEVVEDAHHGPLAGERRFFVLAGLSKK